MKFLKLSEFFYFSDFLKFIVFLSCSILNFFKFLTLFVNFQIFWSFSNFLNFENFWYLYWGFRSRAIKWEKNLIISNIGGIGEQKCLQKNQFFWRFEPYFGSIFTVSEITEHWMAIESKNVCKIIIFHKKCYFLDLFHFFSNEIRKKFLRLKNNNPFEVEFLWNETSSPLQPSERRQSRPSFNETRQVAPLSRPKSGSQGENSMKRDY